jgi:hypothetical protein
MEADVIFVRGGGAGGVYSTADSDFMSRSDVGRWVEYEYGSEPVTGTVLAMCAVNMCPARGRLCAVE